MNRKEGTNIQDALLFPSNARYCWINPPSSSYESSTGKSSLHPTQSPKSSSWYLPGSMALHRSTTDSFATYLKQDLSTVNLLLSISNICTVHYEQTYVVTHFVPSSVLDVKMKGSLNRVLLWKTHSPMEHPFHCFLPESYPFIQKKLESTSSPRSPVISLAHAGFTY